MLGVSRLSLGARVGRYVIESLLARGGTSEVYLAVDGADRVALKLLVGLSPADRARAEREARIAGSLSHPHINRLLGYGELGDDAAYLAFEHLEGETLAHRLSRGPLSRDESRALARRLLDALEHAHARAVVHRDLKPANVFLVAGDPARAVVLDFGLAHAVDASRLTTPGRLLGTPAYMAPEQVRGEAPVDARVDLWSFAVILFEALSATLPFECDSLVGALFQIAAGRPRSLRAALPNAPERLVEVVDRALSATPEQRFATARDLADALDAAFEAAPGEHAPRVTHDEVRLVSAVVCDVSGDRLLLERLVSSVEALAVPAGHAFAALFGLTTWRGDEPSRALALARSLSLVSQSVSVRTGHAVVVDGRVAGEFLRDAAESLPPRGVSVDALTRTLLRCDDESTESGGHTLPEAHGAFVGRELELASLLQSARRAAAQQLPAAVVVLGAQGLGRSALLEVSAAALQRELPDAAVLRARCERHREQSPFAALREALRHAKQPGLDLALLRSTGSADAQAAKDQARTTLHALLRELAARGPLVLAVDDAQWLDPASRELLRGAIDEQVAPFALWLFGDLAAASSLREVAPGASVLTLDVLTPDEAATLVRARAPEAPSARVASVLSRGGGNPRLLDALATHDDPDALPADVESAVRASLDRLSPEDRTFVLCASVFGRTAWQRGVVALGATDRLASLRAQRWITPRARPHLTGETEFEFRSGVVAEVARGVFPAEKRAALHLRAAAWLRDRPGALPEDIATQLELAGERDAAGAAWAEAAAWASAQGALAAACAHCERALRLTRDDARRWEAMAARDDAMQLSGDRDLQREGLDAMADAASRLGEGHRAEHTWRMLHFARMTNDPGLAEDFARRIEGDGRWTAASYTELALLSADRGALSVARAHAVRAQSAARALDDVWTRARAEHAMAYVLVEEGVEVTQGIARYAAAAEDYRRAGDLRREAITLVNRGAAYAGLGQLADALDALDLAIERASAVGNHRSVAVARENRGAVYRMLGDDERAREDLHTALERAASLRFARLAEAAEVELAYLALGPGGTREAQRERLDALAARRIAASADRPSPSVLATSLRLAARLDAPTETLLSQALEALRGLPEPAMEALELSVAVAEVTGERELFTGRLAQTLARCLDEEERAVRTRGILRRYAVRRAPDHDAED